MQIPLDGAEFAPSDRAGAPKVVVVNRLFAKMFGLENPIGRTMPIRKERFEIVGMADDALAFTLKEERRPITDFPDLQSPSPPGTMTYELRTAGRPLDLAGPVRELVRHMDTRLAIHDSRHRRCTSIRRSAARLRWRSSGGARVLALVIAYDRCRRARIFDVEPEDDEADAIERRLGGGQLLEDVDTESRLLNHPADAADLPFDAVQPGDDPCWWLVEHGPTLYAQ